MVIVRLRGGLGNQLFQFAAGSALAQFHKVAFKLDLYFYKKHPFRTFDLPFLNIPVQEATRDEVHIFTGNNPVIRYLNKRENYFHCPKVCAQPHYHYYEDFFNLPSDIYLSGYWQSERYFRSLQTELTKWYSPKNELDTRSKELVSQMNETASVSLHVRRGDYTADSIFGFVPVDYYKQAIQKIQTHVADVRFFVFSDDLEWVKKNISVPNAIFVDHNKGADSYRDMVLMSHCYHNIIANSTFSWWGAWLNPNPDKMVIAPKVWFNKPYNNNPNAVYPGRYYNTKDLIPERWIRL
jgi:hypothetical protein